MKCILEPISSSLLALFALACGHSLVPSDSNGRPPVVPAPPKVTVSAEKWETARQVYTLPDPEPLAPDAHGLVAPSLLGMGPGTPVDKAKEEKWIDSVFMTLNEDAKIGQLLMLRAHSNKGEAYEMAVEDQIKRLQPGGVCFFQGTIDRQAMVTNRYQLVSKIPLMVSMDAEFGLGMRLTGAISYPRQMILGAIRDDEEIYQYGLEMARQCRRLGVHISFSPSVDINNNPANPVINDRSFGDDRYNVAAKAARYMLGLQDGGVLACAKHFPGHGDTGTDSHFALPVIAHDARRLDSLELYPFKTLIRSGVGSFMVAHLNIPAYESDKRRPSTLSRNIITGLLREKLKFDGLIFTDAMEMRAVADSFPPGVADVQALIAGNDVVLLPVNADSAVVAIRRALSTGVYDQEQFTQSVKRVLRYKYRLGLTSPQQVNTEQVTPEINTPSAYLMKRNLYRKAITLVRDRDSIIGLSDDLYLRIGKTLSTNPADSSFRTLRLASLALGDTTLTIFQKHCSKYAPIRHFGVDTSISPTRMQELIDSLSQYDLVLVSHHKTRSKAKDNYGLTRSEIELVGKINAATRMALTVFGNPYSIKYFDEVPTLMVAYTEDPMAQESAAEAWFGAADVTGRLSVNVSPAARYRQGKMFIPEQKRLSYDLPESVGMSSDTLALLDTLAQEMIRTGATPGCQIMVVKDGKVVWNKGYGYYTYESTQPVTTETMFDLASVTKVAATTLSAMKLVNNGQLATTRPLSDYVPELLKTNKKGLLVNEILAHQAGLQPWIPFYKNTIDSSKIPLNRLYRSAMGPGFSIPVAQNLWMKNAYVDSVWQQIYQSELRPDKAYKYSDLTMYLMARAIRNISGKPLEVFAAEQFYRPMGLQYTMYNPWEKGLTNACAPTEQDAYFRQQKIQGYVHDMGAAMLGGVSGHAGLFSNANDLAKLFQMLLNGGEYAGHEYFMPETVRLFTTRHPGSSRRGLGFDMKETDPKATMNMSPLAGANTFGHLGFTGNAVWADPDQNLIFVFLSNRTYPSMDNNKLINGDYRPKAQGVVYRAIGDK